MAEMPRREQSSAKLRAFQRYSAVHHMETSTIESTSDHKMLYGDKEPQTNAKDACVCATNCDLQVTI